MKEIKVSIKCLVYNHEPFLRQCLDGFVMQKTSFAFEAIVHDDASTDKSADIIREYADKYPDIIKPIYEVENQYSKNDDSLNRIIMSAMNPSSKYIAFCEGDDYWTDPYKLQKQVDFLDEHNEYSLCFHNAEILNESDRFFELAQIKSKDYNVNEVFDKWIVPTASILIRRDVINYELFSNKLINGDIFIVLSALSCGKLRGMKETMSVYRVHNNGVTIKRVLENHLNLEIKYIDHYKTLKKLFPFIPNLLVRKKLSNTYINIGKLYMKRNLFYSLYYIIRAFIYSPQMFGYRFFNLVHKKA